MKASGNNTEETKRYDLQSETCERDILAVLQLACGVGVRGLGTRHHHSADKLNQQSDDVKGNEYGRDKSSCLGQYIERLLE